MSFVDASVIVAILNEEPGFEELVKRLSDISTPVYVSPLVRFESVSALVRLRIIATKGKIDREKLIAEARNLVDGFIQALGAREIAIDSRVGVGALDAMARYGKVAGHPAALNFGDCFAYASAQCYRLPLLYKGDDFAQTDMA
ncbi:MULTISPECIES: type II toxin-antitoxin system VapC family toxin [unclassified Brucella]|uniref:type II toxin-antitoxin system VapC family toxin n=1 Tax=unclassified Brucella TaxID=2632610 RepID=UPI00132B9546|nr:PIN domain-containing protein [Brucella sp. 09RB8913]MRN59432.1 PIN domain-containing protein [Brucella sp. 09RB8918]MRN67973.1 PIN domain-containing protein [Brucella sp. 10RB9213]